MFVPIVNTSISASWLILAIIVIRFVFKKMPKAMICILWGLVAIRLICPFSIESPLSLVPSAEIIPEEVLYMEGAQLHDPVEFNGIEAPTVQETVGEAVGETVSQVQTFDVYGSLVWLAGMAAMLLYALISYLRLRHRVMVSINERDNIWLCDQIDSPFILGMFRPRIYMPSEMAEEQAAYVIAHEQAHLHRHDHWWKPFGFLLLSVYWFNPLIWVAYILLSRDIELACDEKVIQSMETPDKQAYSEALLVCSVNRRMIAACPLAFGEVGVKERVKSVLNYKKPAFWVIVISVIVCMVVAVCFLTNPVGFRFDRESDIIVSASHFDMRNAENPIADEMNLAQIGELSSRLADVKKTKRSDKYGGLTPGYQISALLQDGSYIRISGYSLSDNDMVDIEWNGERYVVYDSAFQDYLSHICASGDVASADNAVADKTYTYEKDGIMGMSNVPATLQEDMTAEGLDLFKQGALNDATLSQTEEEAQEVVEVEAPEPEPERVEPVTHTQDILDLAVWTVSNALNRQYHELTPNTQAMEILQVEIDPAESTRAAFSYFERQDERAVTDAALASQMIAVKAVYHVDWLLETESNRADAGAHASYYYVMPSASVPGRWYIHDIVPTTVPEGLELPQMISSEASTPISLRAYGTSDVEAAAQLNAETAVGITSSVPTLASIYKRDGDDPEHYLVTKDGRAGELPLPYKGSAVGHAKVKNSHLDFNYSIYSYEVEVVEPVMDPTTGKILAEAGTYRYFVDMVEFRYLTVFVPNKSV